MYSLFIRELQPSSSTTILDIGVSDEEGPETNMLEKAYPWPRSITCAGLGSGLQLRAAYPEIRYVRIAAGRALPFKDSTFDVVWANAVLEHVGGAAERRFFLNEVLRVSDAAFITVPNRWFPVEHHTAIPFLHWNATLFRAILRPSRLKYWSDARNMDFMSKALLRREWPTRRPAKFVYTGLPLGPFSSNIAVIAKATSVDSIAHVTSPGKQLR
jgi:hypothetical protein